MNAQPATLEHYNAAVDLIERNLAARRRKSPTSTSVAAIASPSLLSV